MTIYVFVPTGDVRPPKKGEWCRNNDGDIWLEGRDYCYEPGQIGTMHEIDVPEGTTQLVYGFNPFSRCHYPPKTIDLPRKKVKQWVHLYLDRYGRIQAGNILDREDGLKSDRHDWRYLNTVEVEV